jgi:hypothetical protein
MPILAFSPQTAAEPVNGRTAPIFISLVSGCFFEQAGIKNMIVNVKIFIKIAEQLWIFR